jgi:hypothetical protein
MGKSTPIAILIGAVIITAGISASILFVERWQIAAPADNDRSLLNLMVFRLDRWTGETTPCLLIGPPLVKDVKLHMDCSAP